MATPALQAALIDAREPEWVRTLTFGCPAVSVTYLPAGDLWLTGGDGRLLAVERKTPSDLLGSLRDGRLFQQIAALRAETPWAYLLITGYLEPATDGTAICWQKSDAGAPLASSWRYDAVQGALLTVQELGAGVLSCAGDGAYEDAVLRLARRERGAHRLAPLREAAAVDDREALLCALPGIGPEKARALLAYCGSPAAALYGLTAPGELPPGFGEAARARVRRTLGLEDGFFLALNVEGPAPEEAEGAVAG